MSLQNERFIAVQNEFKCGLGKAILVALGLSVCSSGLQAAPNNDKSWREGRILVKPRAGLPEAELEKLLEDTEEDVKSLEDAISSQKVPTAPGDNLPIPALTGT